MKNGLRLLVGLMVALSLAACGTPVAQDSGKIRIAASFFPVENFARQVAGDRADVVAVIPNGLEPHDYEPTANDLTNLYDSQLFVYSGAGLEPWAEKIRPDLEAKGVHTLRLSDSVELLSGVSGEKVRDAHRSDPHIWLDPVLAQGIVERIRDALVGLDPNGESVYRANASSVLTKLQALDQDFKNGLSQCEDRTILLSHAAFQYLAKRYNFKTMSISGFSEEGEPSAKDFVGLIDEAKKRGLHFIFFEKKSNPKLAETLAAEIGGETLDLHHIDGGFTPEESSNPNLYEDQMRMNLRNLRTAMECK